MKKRIIIWGTIFSFFMAIGAEHNITSSSSNSVKLVSPSKHHVKHELTKNAISISEIERNIRKCNDLTCPK